MFFKNLYFSWKYLRRNPLFSLIDAAGLVIGITGALFLIFASPGSTLGQVQVGFSRWLHKGLNANSGGL